MHQLQTKLNFIKLQRPGDRSAQLFKDYRQIRHFAMQSSNERKPLRYIFILIN